MTAPSPFYRQHHAVEPPRIDGRHFRPHWRRRSKNLDSLLAARLITDAQFHAAVNFCELVACARYGTGRSPLAAFDADRSRSYTRYLPDVLDIWRWLAAIEKSLGRARMNLLQLAIVDQISWVDLGRRLAISHRDARKVTASVIKKLTRCLDRIEKFE